MPVLPGVIVLFVYCLLQLLFDVLRRSLASSNGFRRNRDGTLMIAQSLRLGATACVFMSWKGHSLSYYSFLLWICGFLFIGVLILGRSLNVESEGRWSDFRAGSELIDRSWGTSLAEALTVVAWANVPIFLLGNVSGSIAVASLVAARAPISFFNVFLEFIDVHTRRFSFTLLWARRKVELVMMTLVSWVFVSMALYTYAPRLLGFIATDEYSGARIELVLFWVLQLAILADKVTLNEQRRVAPMTLSLRSALGLTIACGLFSYGLIFWGAAAGAILSMIFWCISNTVSRTRHILSETQVA
jgi:hypothetical protein